MKCDYKLPPANINCNGYKPTKQVFSFVGGGNLCFIKSAYKKHVRPSLTNNCWDWTMFHSIQKTGGRFICTNPSVAQHIGVDSTLRHIRADIANDY